jgi:hypothetical protein
MATVQFTPHLERFLSAPAGSAPGNTVGAVLAAILGANPKLKGYVLDDQGRIRKHVAVFVDNRLVEDREGLSDPVRDDSEIFVMQALSGG